MHLDALLETQEKIGLTSSQSFTKSSPLRNLTSEYLNMTPAFQESQGKKMSAKRSSINNHKTRDSYTRKLDNYLNSSLKFSEGRKSFADVSEAKLSEKNLRDWFLESSLTENRKLQKNDRSEILKIDDLLVEKSVHETKKEGFQSVSFHEEPKQQPIQFTVKDQEEKDLKFQQVMKKYEEKRKPSTQDQQNVKPVQMSQPYAKKNAYIWKPMKSEPCKRKSLAKLNKSVQNVESKKPLCNSSSEINDQKLQSTLSEHR